MIIEREVLQTKTHLDIKMGSDPDGPWRRLGGMGHTGRPIGGLAVIGKVMEHVGKRSFKTQTLLVMNTAHKLEFPFFRIVWSSSIIPLTVRLAIDSRPRNLFPPIL